MAETVPRRAPTARPDVDCRAGPLGATLLPVPATSPSSPQPPGARTLLLHAGITIIALAIGLGSCRPRIAAREAAWVPDPVDIARAERDLTAARDALATVRQQVKRATPGEARQAPEAARPLASPLDGLVPRQDASSFAMDRFATRLVDMETRSRAARVRAYYGMVTRPLLPGFDDATIKRVTEALATYVEATKAIPWGILGGQRGGAAESWRQVLEDKDRVLREALARDLPPEKVTLLHGRFAMRVPAAGEPLPTPRLAGAAKRRR